VSFYEHSLFLPPSFCCFVRPFFSPFFLKNLLLPIYFAIPKKKIFFNFLVTSKENTRRQVEHLMLMKIFYVFVCWGNRFISEGEKIKSTLKIVRPLAFVVC